MKTWLVSGGYPVVRLNRKGRQEQFYVHHLVLTAFVGPRLTGQTCNHINGDKEDNRVENLEYRTQADNNLHKYRVLGAPPVINRGEMSGRAKLTDGKVRQIREMYATGNYSMEKLASIFGVVDSNIFNVVHRKSWTHVE